MPLCFCTVHGCRDSAGTDPSTGQPKGRELSARIVKSHQIDERTSAYKVAEKEAEDTLEGKIAEITEFLAANTLAGEVSGPSLHPGGRLWAGDNEGVNPEIQSTMAKLSGPQPQMGSRRSREASILSCLADLEASITDLVLEAHSRLDTLVLPSANSSHPPFPLGDLITRSSDIRAELENITYKGPATSASKQAITKKLDELDERLSKAKNTWKHAFVIIQKAHTPTHGIMYDTARHYEPVFKSADPVLQVAFFMILTCQVVLGVTRRGCNFLLNMIQYVIHLTLVHSGQLLSLHDQKLLADIPQDFHSAERHFPLKSKHTIYAVCPNPDCHATYKPTFMNNSPIPIYERHCTYKRFAQGKKCGTPLLQPHRVGSQVVHLPIKPFVGYSFKDWVAGLVSRPELEGKMDAAWNSSWCDGEMKDIFDGEILRDFNGPDGQSHFGDGKGEGRYVFSLCVDYFNPLGNKQAGKKKSIGLVSLVCLNLPPDLRYKPKNMFLYGVIPGPKEPPLDCINHYLRYLIDELEEFWDPGVRFTRTHKCYYGRVIRCAIVCVVCDLPAARKTIGFGSIKHKQMCAFCHCTRKSHGLGNTNLHTWRRRTNEEYRADAKRYMEACNSKEQDEIFQATGIRYSELLRLEYFDPSRFVVVDAMHNLFLGLIHEHFDILGMKLKDAERDSIVLNILIQEAQYQSLSPNEQKSMEMLINLLQLPLNNQSDAERHATIDKVIKFHLKSLELACKLLHVPLSPIAQKKTRLFKSDYAKALVAWRLQQTETGHSATFKRGGVLTSREILQIRSDIEHMITPSWLTSIPTNLSDPSHGKLKADQWRTIGTTYLPVSLVRLWDQEQDFTPRKKMLHATLSLISAVIIASSWTTSSAKADLYLQHMQAYYNSIRDLIPNYEFRPNHHMALHLADYLRYFGPVHAWWTFPFERLIGMLQRIPTSFKHGELEETISKTFVKSANLRSLLSKDGCPRAIKYCETHFRQLTDPKIRNSLLLNISTFLADPENDPPVETEVSICTVVAPESHVALREHFRGTPQAIKPLSFITIDGLTYSTLRRHHGNSSILIRHPTSANETVPVQIEDIVQVDNDVLFVVRLYQRRADYDPFKCHPFLHTTLWQSERGSLTVVKPCNTISHFASLKVNWFGQEHLVIISLLKEH